MPLFPEHLLVRRYSIQADLWGLRRELSELERDLARANEELGRIHTNVDSLGRLSKPAIKQSERHLGEIRRARERSALLTQLAEDKRNELARVEQDLRVAYKALGQGTLSAEALVENGIATDRPAGARKPEGPGPRHAYDVFISHASEDKNDLVRPLVAALQELSLKIWYDESIVKVGDGLRESIDKGLLNSRFGVLVLSPSFLAKQKWTKYELDSLFIREIEMGKVILPLWHKVTKDEVLNFSPKLADKAALNTAIMTIDDIALEIALVVNDNLNHRVHSTLPLP